VVCTPDQPIITRLLITQNRCRIRTIGGIDLGPKKSCKLGYSQVPKQTVQRNTHLYFPYSPHNFKIKYLPNILHGSTNFNSDPGLR
jgi:hypothetical protein